MVANAHSIHVFRLQPGTDLRNELEAYARAQNLHAAWIISCVGSVVQTNLRYANRPGGAMEKGYFEILSLAGTVSINGCHLHLCVADRDGNCTGGHLLYETIIYTTAEVVMGASATLSFSRGHDAATGCNELVIETLPDASFSRDGAL